MDKMEEFIDIKKNAVLGDPELAENLRMIHRKWADFCISVAGEAWGLPLLDQKIKAFITIAVDVVNGNQTGPGAAFGAHVSMAVKQGATYDEIEELLLFMSVYAGFNKTAPAFGALKGLVENGIFPDKERS